MGWPSFFSAWIGENKPQKQMALSKATERLWDMCCDHQYSAGDFSQHVSPWDSEKSLRKLRKPVLVEHVWDWMTSSGPSQSPCFYSQTCTAFIFHFYLCWHSALIFEWAPPDGCQPKGGPRRWSECSFHVWMRVFLAWGADMWHEWNRHQLDDETNSKEKKKNQVTAFIFSHLFYLLQLIW